MEPFGFCFQENFWFAVLGIELRVSNTLNQYSTTEPSLQSDFCFLFREKVSLQVTVLTEPESLDMIGGN